KGVFFGELETLYQATVSEQPAILPDLPIQYADFAAWQRDWLQGSVLADQLSHWKTRLADAPSVLELPTDHPRPPIESTRGASCLFNLPQPLSKALQTVSQQEGVSLFMTLTAAFQTLLSRYSGQEDVLLGTVTADRGQAETEHLIGFLVNTLVLRTDLSGDPTFRELLGRVREGLLGAQEQQDVPFEYLVKELQPDRSSGQNPFFQVMLAFEPLPSSSAPLPQWTLTTEDIQTGAAKFDLYLELEERPDGLHGRLEYRTDLFEEATIRRLIGHWQTLLEGIVAHPEQRLSALPLLAEAERQQVLVDWNATQSISPIEQGIHHMFESQVERTPEACALVFGEQEMSYRELNRRANRLAHHLRHLGVGPEVLVGLCLERSSDMVVGLLGILKAGGAYVPLDPTYPQDRLAFMLQDSQISVLLTQQQLEERLSEHHIPIICLDTDLEGSDQESSENPSSTVKAENLAYVIYTSGSTGKPKGVLITHAAIVDHCSTIKKYYELDANDRVLQFSTITFDPSLEQIFSTLISGATLVLRNSEVWSATDLQKKMQDCRLTVMNIPTSYWHYITQEWANTSTALAHNQLRLLIVGGDRLLPEYLDLWQQLPMHSVRLLNAYGPTETTITATIFEIPRQSYKNTPLKNIPIGRPLANRTIYILDTYGNPVPIGIPGELYIGGSLLARGYLNRAELTVEKFVPDPFSKDADARLYRTGDLARYLPDGNIEFLGRIDHQVKIRGFRIEPGEIEMVLRQHSAVREAFVQAYKHEGGDKLLAAYVVLEKQDTTIDELRLFLKKHLPDYMVPSDFVLLDSIPMTSSGKVDRQALPVPDLSDRVAENTFVAPTLAVHYQLQHIWEDLLNVKPIGMQDNFFSLGGHSLLAAQMIDRIEQVCGKKLLLATLFAGATIQHLADALLQETYPPSKEETDTRTRVVTVQAGGSRQPFFFLHGDWHGGGLYCLNLAEHLSKDQPFYTLEPYRFEGLAVPPTLEEMAATHTHAMREVQPEGPYLLGGWCNGGLLAYEMARQLHAAGQTVALLVALDMGTPFSYRLTRAIITRCGKLLGLGQEQQVNWFLRYIYLRVPSFRKRTQETAGVKTTDQTASQSKVGRRSLGQRVRQALFPSVEALRYNWFGIYRWVAGSYAPGSYPGKLTLLWSNEADAHSSNWRTLSGAKEIEEQVFPGIHVMYGNENLPLLAERLNAYLLEAQAMIAHERA
ncbi:MAG TPA: amino acid adenylation domain-containing protein, partial [Ktedonobacteraceae bacterium]|nr:amino acid adenylation domain-containing protein [Ktedonobacteraceae bacterium]